MDLYQAIHEFHTKFGLEKPPAPKLLGEEASDFRIQFLYEEVNEYCDASAVNDKAGMLDALVDLVYVALGTAYLHGFDFNTAFQRVHEANMQKVRANRPEQSKRGTSLDVVKPHGWQPPNLEDLV